MSSFTTTTKQSPRNSRYYTKNVQLPVYQSSRPSTSEELLYREISNLAKGQVLNDLQQNASWNPTSATTTSTTSTTSTSTTSTTALTTAFPTTYSNPPSIVGDVAVYSFGDSQAEVLDYVFHGDSRYRTWHDRRVGWRSGWSARGLYMEGNLQRILVPVSECRAKNAVVYLTFGSTDIDINLPYKRHMKGQYDLDVDQFVEEMVTNVWNAVLRLRAMNEDPAIDVNVHVCLVFPYVPLPTTQAYWNKVFGNDPAPHRERVAMYESFIGRICEKGFEEDGIGINILGSSTTGVAKMTNSANSTSNDFVVHVLNVREDFDRGGFDAYQRKIAIAGRSIVMIDHHPDYIATQTIVARKIREMGVGLDLIPPLTNMFPHVPRDIHKYSVISHRDFYFPADEKW